MMSLDSFPHISMHKHEFQVCFFFFFLSFNLPGDTLAAPCLSGWKVRIRAGNETSILHVVLASALHKRKLVWSHLAGFSHGARCALASSQGCLGEEPWMSPLSSGIIFSNCDWSFLTTLDVF